MLIFEIDRNLLGNRVIIGEYSLESKVKLTNLKNEGIGVSAKVGNGIIFEKP